eukprot:TRINITY_DN5760_c0_g1_i1.p1 TRINITY_DN5760_c0_g1~~TRINITY_DN5760_c0_g1_i1.p1  ORF type:complete len:278 (+),score=39.21 TRINITY_DN5760_c0_g1_i1:653-1486(+)
MQIVDSSQITMELTLWGEVAINFAGEATDIIAVKNARLGEYNGSKNLSTISGTQCDINPNIELAHELYQWYIQNASSITTNSHNRMDAGFNDIGTFASLQAAVEQAQMDGDNKPVIKKIKATLIVIYHDERSALYYKAAPDNTNKVVENSATDQPWYCPKLNKYYDTYCPRYILSMTFADVSGSQYVNVFDDCAKVILKQEAQYLEVLKNNGNEAELENFFEAPLGKHLWIKVKAQEDHYQEDTRIRYTMCGVETIDYVTESRRLLSIIQSYCSPSS